MDNGQPESFDYYDVIDGRASDDSMQDPTSIDIYDNECSADDGDVPDDNSTAILVNACRKRATNENDHRQTYSKKVRENQVSDSQQHKQNEPESSTVTQQIIAAATTNKTNSEEIFFAMSLVGPLERLPPQKRAMAKVNILRYLTELEYGSSSKL